MRVLLLSDTHISPSRPGRRLPDAVYDLLLDGVDAILHAGDVTAPELLHELGGFAPVHAVLGNNDVSLRLPETLQVELDGVRVAMIHDSGQKTGRLARMRRRFPGARLVVFGHSHIPWDEGEAGFRVFNPGSPTDKRRQPTGTIGLLDVVDGVLLDARIVPVAQDASRGPSTS